MFYESRLQPIKGLELQEIRSQGRIRGSGLRYVPVAHQGNQNSSPEEAEAIAKLVAEILGSSTTWVDRHGAASVVTLADILIIAPYNAQVFDLKDRIPGARIGTVDKFQGQEAPIVIYSLTTSTHADAPRGMNFLYSLNRLNVATSRARALSILVCSPALFEPFRMPDAGADGARANGVLPVFGDGGHVLSCAEPCRPLCSTAWHASRNRSSVVVHECRGT